MTDFPYQIIGFDLDGTLLDTSPELTVSVNHTLGLAGLPPLTQEEIKPMVGLGAKHMLSIVGPIDWANCLVFKRNCTCLAGSPGPTSCM